MNISEIRDFSGGGASLAATSAHPAQKTPAPMLTRCLRCGEFHAHRCDTPEADA